MPIYSYRCSNCKFEFETKQSMKDKPLVRCRKCKKHKLQRIISKSVGISFRGSGFYVNDSKSGGV